jgi:hypothetical protein
MPTAYSGSPFPTRGSHAPLGAALLTGAGAAAAARWRAPLDELEEEEDLGDEVMSPCRK